MRVLTNGKDAAMLLFNVITEFFRVIIAYPECRHDLIMALIYLLAVPTVILWHHRVWVIYLMACAAYALSAVEAAGLL
jgi:hypothetical protein